MKRRDFVRAVNGTAGLWAVAPGLWSLACSGSDDPFAPGDPGTPPGTPEDPTPPTGTPQDPVLEGRLTLPAPETITPDGIALTARPTTVSLEDGSSLHAWTFRDSLPGPTLRARSGDQARVVLENGLGEESIVHWHGLDVPEHADGHPRLAVESGESYVYDFSIRSRAGTYWYHPHPHGRTGPQAYMGLAGFFIVDDLESDSLGLPAGAREIPLVLQDKRLDGAGQLVYAPSGFDLMEGYLGSVPFVNGAPFPYQVVDRDLYRLRILNGSNARIYDLALSDGSPLVLVGTDGGLLESARSLDSIFLGPAERVDVLVDFSGKQPGDRIVLRSREFRISGGMGMGMGSSSSQGQAMDLVEFVVRDSEVGTGSLPAALASLPPAPPQAAAPVREFRFSSHMMSHLINGRSFGMERVDHRITLGDTEIWRFINESPMPHPVHMHAGQFRVLSRSGGRGQVFPWEDGLKDTVLLMPFESVDVVVRFEEYRGLYLLHCHILEHEDAGMMMNFEVI
ncbi:MAG: multicopper oxidase domain-containing protein [marine benthic group bacterium]|nr:multicopper oxidase domain-containing protein [Gemmatimonadota bacterium]